MGHDLFSKTEYHRALGSLGISKSSGPVTAKAEQQARHTGKLRESVDPAVDVIRRSLMRFDPRPGGGWLVTVGVPVPFETTTDTTGSMGKNVDIAMHNLPDTYALVAEMLPGYDLQMALGIFGDTADKFILQRPQFEMTAEKIVSYLADMVPERDGDDFPEDQHYGLFAAAYLTDAYINRIGLKGYHFCVSDAYAHNWFSMGDLKRVFGNSVLDYVNENVKRNFGENKFFTPEQIESLSIREVVQDLLKISHAFFLQVKDNVSTHSFWSEIYGENRIISIPDTHCLPQVQAAIVGLTEGTLTLENTEEWLTKHGVEKYTAASLTKSLSKIPIGAQELLRANLKRPLPKMGDVFSEKTDLWPADGDTLESEQSDRMSWL